ncbi:uncharacterized protein LOC116266791 [Nymphaea colorata]|uniref:uncharacterized protein LOC116266791 n=1 Tax=Nymphaea colorata TaxID=210225 RepID=UPI00129E6A55|nr:uncharacterized protein LOC116266791 [Nymphaea colorata]
MQKINNGYRCYNPKTGRVYISRHVFDELRLKDLKEPQTTLNVRDDVYDSWLNAEILGQGADTFHAQSDRIIDEIETATDIQLDSTTSSTQTNNMSSPTRFSGVVYTRRSITTIAPETVTACPRRSERVPHPIDRWIGQVIQTIDDQFQVIVSSLIPILFVGVAGNNVQLPDPALRQNIGQWLQAQLKPHGYVICLGNSPFTLRSHLYSMTIKVRSRLLSILFYIIALSI